MNKEIKIFLSSSITELHTERIEIGNFFRVLNKRFKPYGISFDLCMCEDMSEVLSFDGKQNEYNEEIKSSEYFYTILYKKAGTFTLEEFDVALESFKKNGLPKIITFFKEEDAPFTDEIETFMARLDNDLHHYYTKFKSIDTVKLKILLEFCQRPELSMNVEFKDAKLFVNGNQIQEIDLTKLPFYDNHDAISKLRRQIAKLEEEFSAAKKASVQNPDDNSLWEKCYDISKQKSEALDKLHSYELQLMQVSSNIVKLSSNGEYITHRTKLALELFDDGKIDEAIAILDADEFEKDFNRAQQKAEELKREMSALVKELTIKADILKAMKITEQTEKEIIALYEKAKDIIVEHRLNISPLLDYVWFLCRQNLTKEALVIGEAVANLLKTHNNVDWLNSVKVLRMLGYINIRSENYDIAEKYLLEALNIFLSAPKNETSENNLQVCYCYAKLGELYNAWNKWNKAEEAYTKAVSYAENCDDRIELVQIFYPILSFFRERKNFEKAQKYANTILELLKTTELNTEYQKRVYCHALREISQFYVMTNNYEEADSCLKKAVEVAIELTNNNPFGNGIMLKFLYCTLGDLYKEKLFSKQDYSVSNDYFIKAIKIAESFAARNKESASRNLVLPYVALSYNYRDQKRNKEAEELLLKAFDIVTRSNDKSPTRIAWVSTALANNYRDLGEFVKAEEYYNKAIAIRREWAEKELRFKGELANSLCAISELYSKMGNFDLANSNLKEAIEILESLYSKQPQFYEKVLMEVYNRYAELLLLEKKHAESETMFLKSIEIRKSRVNKNIAPERILLYPYYKLALLYDEIGKEDLAIEYYKQAQSIAIKFQDAADHIKNVLNKISQRLSK